MFRLSSIGVNSASNLTAPYHEKKRVRGSDNGEHALAPRLPTSPLTTVEKKQISALVTARHHL